MKKLAIFTLVIVCLFATCACSSNPDNEKKEQQVGSQTVTEKVRNSSPTNDLDLGLKNVKVDNVSEELTEEQKTVLEYYDDDYLHTSYEFLQRYPQVYEGAQIRFMGVVKKIISSTNDDYQMLVWMGPNENLFYSGYRGSYQSYQEEHKGECVIISGKQTESRLIEGDEISVYGRNTGIDSYTIDGTSYILPKVDVYRAYVNHDKSSNPIRFDVSYIKKVAEAIFGDDIEVREPTEEEIHKDPLTGSYGLYERDPFIVCELDNQSNSKFNKYFFLQRRGQIRDGLNEEGDSIYKTIEFAPDFEHYFLFRHDISLKTLTLEYYDKDLKKVWKREFEQTEDAIYDYTENNIYMVANNELYIINTETGEDTYKPSYVGAKTFIRKMDDGILMLSYGPSDAIMKTDLQGNIIWKLNLDEESMGYSGAQFVNNKIIIDVNLVNSLKHYIVVNNDDGSLIIDAESKDM